MKNTVSLYDVFALLLICFAFQSVWHMGVPDAGPVAVSTLMAIIVQAFLGELKG